MIVSKITCTGITDLTMPHSQPCYTWQNKNTYHRASQQSKEEWEDNATNHHFAVTALPPRCAGNNGDKNKKRRERLNQTESSYLEMWFQWTN
jgi:hypothetical protein